MYRFQGLESLMTTKGITDSKTFDAYLKAVLSPRETQGVNLEGFEWDAPQLDFTYEQLQAEAKIDVMATYVDLNSPANPAGKNVEIKTLTGSIPRMRHAIALGENDYRKQLIALNEVKSVAAFQNVSESTAISQFISKRLFETVNDISTSFKESLNYQVGQMKSLGKVEINEVNNPRNALYKRTFSAQVPTENYIDKQWFNADGTPIETADPIVDLRDFNRELRWKVNGYQNICVELSEKYLYKLLQHPAVLKAVGYYSTGIGLRYTKANDDNALAVARGLAFEAQKAAFKALIECDELIVDRTQCGIEKLNTTTKKFERTLVAAFADNTILIRPTGKIGVIKNVVPLRKDGSAITGAIYGGRGLIEYVYNPDTYTQRWQGELTALAVPTRPQDMYYMNGVAEAKEPAQGDGGDE